VPAFGVQLREDSSKFYSNFSTLLSFQHAGYFVTGINKMLYNLQPVTILFLIYFKK